MATKQELEQHITKLVEQVSKLTEKQISKSAASATKAALVFLRENVSDVVSVDMDTSYGHVTFKLRR